MQHQAVQTRSLITKHVEMQHPETAIQESGSSEGNTPPWCRAIQACFRSVQSSWLSRLWVMVSRDREQAVPAGFHLSWRVSRLLLEQRRHAFCDSRRRSQSRWPGHPPSMDELRNRALRVGRLSKNRRTLDLLRCWSHPLCFLAVQVPMPLTESPSPCPGFPAVTPSTCC